MLRRIVTLISMSFVAVVATEKSEKLDNIQNSLDKIISKAGIQFNGEFRSQYLPSKIEGDKKVVNDTDRQVESNEYTSVDFDISARPNSMVGAKVIFRFHQNWQNFFSDVANPIFSRWISIDGNVKDMFGFHAGDLKEKYSPLTLFSPEIEILNEPYIFARQREIAQRELFLGDNYRVLQGVTLKLDAEVYPIFNELHVGLIGTRLRNIEVSIQNGNKSVPANQTEERSKSFSKYLVGGNLDFTLFKGVQLGLTDLFIFDQKGSYRLSDTTADTIAQRTNVFSVRPGIDIGKMIASESLTLGLNAEIAISADDSTSFVVVDSATRMKDFKSTTITGSAIDITAKVGFASEKKFGISANVSFIANGKDFRNEMAQSPTFIGDRIMNKENNATDDTNLYNTFDALYHTIFKFTPSKATNRWAKSPFMATSYNRSIFNQSDFSRFNNGDYFDPAVQLIMPYGPATPNRTGIKSKISAKLINEAIKIDVLVSSLKEVDEVAITESISIPKTSFTQIGGGLKVDISKMVTAIKYPLEVSGSYVMTTANRPALGTIEKGEMQSNFLNAGLYYKFWKRTALMAGYQMISNTFTEGSAEEEVSLGNWSLGLEWKVADGADVVATVGQMTKENPEVIGDVKQTMADVSLRVKF